MQSFMNLRTTGIGMFGSALLYWSSIGFRLPDWHNPQEVFAFGCSTLIAMLGIAAKDGSTGSAPGATS